jgi:teichuronic acid biosynthesis glycosyltransferase TuaC
VKMKIAMLTDLPFLYQDKMYLSEIETRLKGVGFDIRVFIIRSSRTFQRLDSRTGFFRMLAAVRLVRELNKFDIIHTQFTFPLGTAMTLLSRLQLLKKPIIVHTHGYDVFNVPSIHYGLRRNNFGRFASSSTLKNAQKIIAVCKKAKTEISHIVEDDSKVELVYNGVNEDLFNRDTSSDSINDMKKIREENDLIFLSVASIVPVKNHLRLVNVFNRLVQKYKMKYRIKLVLLGQYHSYQGNLHDSASIIYLGPKQHAIIPQYYNAADAFVLPSLSEAHPWSVLEAMSCELVVLGSNVGGIPETLQDPRFLVDPFNDEDMVKKMSHVVEMSMNERREIGTSNRSKILKSFTLANHVDKLKKIYDDLS